MNLIKRRLHDNIDGSAFRFITVDAYMSAIPFYLKNDFNQLTEKEQNDHTRLMFFDLMEFA